MSGKNISETGKNVSEVGMSTVALKSAVKWHDELMDVFCKGRRDKESAIRSRLSEKSGVPESYLFRLAHKRRDMRDVAGEVYRLLEVAHRKYVLLCEANENAARAYREERLAIKAIRHAVYQEPADAGLGEALPLVGTKEKVK